ncbi:flavin reductase family protein [Caballeronia sp. LjRoot34]|uniref:flavin reductase n=1 Tax=Caballeronia sp. LjRoot34 TaxID=3342325 RepID=UPI003ECDD8DC
MQYIDDEPAMFCPVAREVEHGTHTVIIGNVLDVIVPEVRDPLVYMGGRYLRLDAGAGFHTTPDGTGTADCVSKQDGSKAMVS